MDYPEPWPLGRLVLRTPRLELRPDDDAGLAELVEQAYAGVHPPRQMPFSQPWTDADPRYLGRSVLQYHWRQRAQVSPENWTVQFLVRRDGRVIGSQSLAGVGYSVSREVSTGSWLGRRHQRQGYGTEMRAAVLAFAFDQLGARTARSAAFVDNAASLAVSAKLGYRPDGTETWSRRGEPVEQIRLLLRRADFRAHRPPWPLQVSGWAECLPLLGAGPVPDPNVGAGGGSGAGPNAGAGAGAGGGSGAGAGSGAGPNAGAGAGSGAGAGAGVGSGAGAGRVGGCEAGSRVGRGAGSAAGPAAGLVDGPVDGSGSGRAGGQAE